MACFLHTIGNAHCWFAEVRPENPEARMDVNQMISYWGYPSEEYEVTTQDGYILKINRIPYGKTNGSCSVSRPVVFLQHGFLMAASCWISNLPNNSLGFLLADAGYDVWLGNSRGSIWSRKHLYLSPDSKEFWSFSYDEMAKYDLPAILDLIKEKTQQEKVYYVGHSQGTAIAFAALSTNPKVSERIKINFAMAPISILNDLHGPILFLAKLPETLFKLLFGEKEFLSNNFLVHFIGWDLCNREFFDTICDNLLLAIGGFNTINFNKSRIDIYLSQNPAGSSVQDIRHFLQTINSKRFEAYDWGSPALNMKHYNQPTPPPYDTSKVEVPTAIWFGEKDLLSGSKDVEQLLSKLPNVINQRLIRHYNHIDFVWANDAYSHVYSEIIAILNHLENSKKI
ncbi:gastric triacylglycerol lipase-like [Trichosurus vulpecula]|uniref:gastric triacylglycerol lipase-like n=1 Tax=Trichosurus vulpecula TaxID=9337 RepID=UPI00186AD0D5|nr:gastric triacylglycerol lipase-like [Trichosurus vulpecula]